MDSFSLFLRYYKVTTVGSQTEGLKTRAKQINNGFPSCYLMWTIKKVTYIPSDLLSSSPKIASLSPKSRSLAFTTQTTKSMIYLMII